MDRRGFKTMSKNLYEIKFSGSIYVLGLDDDDAYNTACRVVRKEEFESSGLKLTLPKKISRLSNAKKSWKNCIPWGGSKDDATVEEILRK